MLTWKADKGLTVFINGAERGSVLDPIELQGHTTEKSSNLVIGHSNVLEPANGEAKPVAKLYISICTLSETVVTKVEATRIFVYYWGHSKYIMSSYVNFILACHKCLNFVPLVSKEIGGRTHGEKSYGHTVIDWRKVI